jgi:hypothetical protein
MMPVVITLLFASGSTSPSNAGPYSLVLLAVLLPIIVFVVVTGSVLRTYRKQGGLAQPYTPTRTKALSPDLYDPAKYKLFSDSLEAASIGAGVPSPELFVTLFPWPVAYATDKAGLTINDFLFKFGTREHFDKMAIVVSKELLESDLSNSEAEAIVADVLARMVLSPGQNVRNTSTGHLAKEVQLDPAILEKLKRESDDIDGLEQILIQDTWAARLTGQPGALKSAIIKSRDLLKDRPVLVEFADFYTFVEPPHDWDYGGWKLSEHYRKDDYDVLRALAKSRDRVLELRIENLDRLEKHAIGQPVET